MILSCLALEYVVFFKPLFYLSSQLSYSFFYVFYIFLLLQDPVSFHCSCNMTSCQFDSLSLAISDNGLDLIITLLKIALSTTKV